MTLKVGGEPPARPPNYRGVYMLTQESDNSSRHCRLCPTDTPPRFFERCSCTRGRHLSAIFHDGRGCATFLGGFVLWWGRAGNVAQYVALTMPKVAQFMGHMYY
jgi:hypothetical protein